jgi:hypothetical protein
MTWFNAAGNYFHPQAEVLRIASGNLDEEESI